MRLAEAIARILPLFLCAAAVFGQLSGKSVTGTVTDEQGGVLPGVMATLQGVDATRTITSDETGEFRFYNVAPGPYKLTLSLQGFAETVRENIIIEVGKNVDLQMVMTMAGVSAAITVRSRSELQPTSRRSNFRVFPHRAIRGR